MTLRLALLLTAALIGLVMAVTQHYAFELSWYWVYWWLDSVMHFAGGTVITLIAYALGARRFALLFLSVALVSVGWEVYEYTIGISRADPFFLSDTVLDLSMDLIGLLAGWGIIHVWHRAFPSPLPAAPDASPGPTSSLP